MLAAFQFKTPTMLQAKVSINLIRIAFLMGDLTVSKIQDANFVSILMGLDPITEIDPSVLDLTQPVLLVHRDLVVRLLVKRQQEAKLQVQLLEEPPLVQLPVAFLLNVSLMNAANSYRIQML